jgi:hypothetical protein
MLSLFSNKPFPTKLLITLTCDFIILFLASPKDIKPAQSISSTCNCDLGTFVSFKPI